MATHWSPKSQAKRKLHIKLTLRNSSPDHCVQKLPGLVVKHQDFSRPPGQVTQRCLTEPVDFDDSIDVDCEESSIQVQKIPAFCWTPASHLAVSEESTAERHFFPSSGDSPGRKSTEMGGDLSEELLIAAKSNSPEQCRTLLDSDQTVNPDFSNSEGWTALHFAAHHGFVKVCEVLLDYGERTNINCKTEQLQTPLHLACTANFKDVVQTLVRAGANLNVVDADGNSPLHIAVIGGFKEVVQWLLMRGPDLTIKNLAGKTAADLAQKEILAIFLSVLRSREVDQTPMQKVPITKSRKDEVSHMMTKVRPGSGSFTRSMSNPEIDEFRIKKPSPLDFEALQELGRGSFGEVYLVQKLDTMKLYAMKVLPKHRILGQNLLKYAITERNVMSCVRHPFIVALNYAFQTADKLFLILDYCPGGDLGWHLQREKRFSEFRTRVYLCEIILAIEELHRRNIIFRDLKPDNVLLDAEGHAMLTDFGLSKEDISDNEAAKSFCGSVAYLAPEMLLRNGHGKAVDWYLLGVLMYEMLVGQPPYFSPNKDQLFQNIQKARLKLPPYISHEAKSLLLQLLQRDPAKRLGSSKRDAEEIKEHTFFFGVNWDSVARREMKVPMPPRPNLNLGSISSEKVYGRLTKSEGGNYVTGWSFVTLAVE